MAGLDGKGASMSNNNNTVPKKNEKEKEDEKPGDKSADMENANGKKAEDKVQKKKRVKEEDEKPGDKSADMENANGKKAEDKVQKKKRVKEEDEKPGDKSADMENANGKKTEDKVQKKKREKEEDEKPGDTSSDMENANGKNTEDKVQKKKRQKRPLPKPPIKNQAQPDNATPKQQLPDLGGKGSKGRNLSSVEPLPNISSENQQNQKNSTIQEVEKPGDTSSDIENANGKKAEDKVQKKKRQKQHYTLDKKNTVESKGSSIILGLKGIIMVAAIALISLSEEISKAKSCDLEKALKSVSLNYTVPCTYDDIKEISTTLRYLGISLLAVNFLFFLLTLFFLLLPRICKLVLCILFSHVAIFSVFMLMEYNDILDSKTAEKDMNYVQLQSTMAIWLEAHYTSDNISSSDVISNNWNKFFIEYDCCAVNQVQGTTNDFDSTPWCTTSGSCQATSSQIPKTCCNYVTEDDYESAPSGCHSSVNPGTFRSNCMNVIKQLSAVNVEECQLSLLQMLLIIIATLELIATAFEIITVIIWIILWVLDKSKSKKEDKKKKENEKR